MRILKSFIFSLIIVCMIACNHSNRAGNDESNQWFDKGAWRKGLTILPDESVNKKEFYGEFQKNKELWIQAFEYLKNLHPDSLETGKINLSGEDLYATISEYVTKNEEEAKFESHRKYADIQYVISGEEKIGIENFKKPEVSVPYDETKDVAFYSVRSRNFRVADNRVFFVFFPDDLHCPGVKTGENMKVKKLVIKVRLN